MEAKGQVQLYKNPDHICTFPAEERNSGELLIVTNDNVELRSHKVTLSANLKYFEAMFGNDFEEKMSNTIFVHLFDAKAMKLILEYAYTGVMLLTQQNVLLVAQMSDYFGDYKLRRACVKYLSKLPLELEESYVTFQWAEAMDFNELRIVARAKLHAVAEQLSTYPPFLACGFEGVRFLVSAKVGLDPLRRALFEGIVNWLVHDAKSRAQHAAALLASVELEKLPSEYLLLHMAGVASRASDEQAMVHALEEFADEHVLTYNIGTVHGNNLYFLKDAAEGKPGLRIYDPLAKSVQTVDLSKTSWETTTMCACDNYVYFCGGKNSSNVTKYDPQARVVEELPPMSVIRSKAAAIVYNGLLTVLGGENGSGTLDSVEQYDVTSKIWIELPSMCVPRKNLAITVLNGWIFACGGDDKGSAELYDPLEKCWQPIARMNRVRSSYLLVTHDGKLLAIGGSNLCDHSIEAYQPDQNSWKLCREMSTAAYTPTIRSVELSQ